MLCYSVPPHTLTHTFSSSYSGPDPPPSTPSNPKPPTPLFFLPFTIFPPRKAAADWERKNRAIRNPETSRVILLQCQADTIHTSASQMCHLILMSGRCLQHTAIALSSKSSCKRGSQLHNSNPKRIARAKLYVLKAGWRVSQQPLQ